MAEISEQQKSLVIISSYQFLKFEEITTATSEELIELIKKLKPLQNKMERAFIFHHTFLTNMSESLSPSVKATWIADSFDIEGIPVAGENICINLSQLIDLALMIEPNPAVLTLLAPNPASVGDTVTITGTGFIGTTEVLVGQLNIQNVQISVPCVVISDTEITFVVPTSPDGVRGIHLTNPKGNTNQLQLTIN